MYFNYDETMMARLAPLLKKEAAENPVAGAIFIMLYFYF
jgi:hypothetical protein